MANFFSFFDMPFQPLNANVSSRMIAGQELMFVEHRVKKGHIAVDDRHVNEQMTLVMRGSIRMTIDGISHLMKPGNAILIPSNVIHTCEVLEDSVVIEVFSPPRKEWLK